MNTTSLDYGGISSATSNSSSRSREDLSKSSQEFDGSDSDSDGSLSLLDNDEALNGLGHLASLTAAASVMEVKNGKTPTS